MLIRASESFRHDADDSEVPATDLEGAAEHHWIAAVLLPKAVAHDRNPFAATGLFFVGQKGATVGGRHAEHEK